MKTFWHICKSMKLQFMLTVYCTIYGTVVFNSGLFLITILCSFLQADPECIKSRTHNYWCSWISQRILYNNMLRGLRQLQTGCSDRHQTSNVESSYIILNHMKNQAKIFLAKKFCTKIYDLQVTILPWV